MLSAFSKIWSRCLPFASTRRSRWKRPQGPFSSGGKCRNTASDSQESTRWSSSGSRILLKALYMLAAEEVESFKSQRDIFSKMQETF